jgi:hypothetical protein
MFSNSRFVICNIKADHPVSGDGAVYPLNRYLYLIQSEDALFGNGFSFQVRQFSGTGNETFNKIPGHNLLNQKRLSLMGFYRCDCNNLVHGESMTTIAECSMVVTLPAGRERGRVLNCALLQCLYERS